MAIPQAIAHHILAHIIRERKAQLLLHQITEQNSVQGLRRVGQLDVEHSFAQPVQLRPVPKPGRLDVCRCQHARAVRQPVAHRPIRITAMAATPCSGKGRGQIGGLVWCGPALHGFRQGCLSKPRPIWRKSRHREGVKMPKCCAFGDHSNKHRGTLNSQRRKASAQMYTCIGLFARHVIIERFSAVSFRGVYARFRTGRKDWIALHWP